MSRTMILASAGLAGYLVLGTATVALADDGSPSPTPSKTSTGLPAASGSNRAPARRPCRNGRLSGPVSMVPGVTGRPVLDQVFGGSHGSAFL